MNYTASLFALGGFFLWVVIATLIWARRMRKLKKEYSLYKSKFLKEVGELEKGLMFPIPYVFQLPYSYHSTPILIPKTKKESLIFDFFRRGMKMY